MASEVIGFIGLGTMGASMAANLQKAGYKLVVHDLHRQAASHVISRPAPPGPRRRARSPRNRDVIFTSLPEPPDVEAVALGAGRAARRHEAGRGLLRPLDQFAERGEEAARRLRREGRAHARRAGERRAAGRRPRASSRSGSAASRRRSTGTRRCSTRSATRRPISGRSARATVAKLVHNMSGYAIVCALAETFAMGVKAGVEPLALWNAVRQGAAGRRFTFDALVDQFLPGTYDPPAFALKLAHKDVSLANALGRELGVPMRMCNLALAEMTEAMARGWDGRDSRVVDAAAAGARRRRDRGRPGADARGARRARCRESRASGQGQGPLLRGRTSGCLRALALPDRLVDRQHLLRAQHHRHVDHLAVDRDRAAAGRDRLVIGRDDLARGRDLVGARREFLVQDRHLARMDHRGAAEAEPARAPDRLAERVEVLVVRDRADEAERQDAGGARRDRELLLRHEQRLRRSAACRPTARNPRRRA